MTPDHGDRDFAHRLVTSHTIDAVRGAMWVCEVDRRSTARTDAGSP